MFVHQTVYWTVSVLGPTEYWLTASCLKICILLSPARVDTVSICSYSNDTASQDNVARASHIIAYDWWAARLNERPSWTSHVTRARWYGNPTNIGSQPPSRFTMISVASKHSPPLKAVLWIQISFLFQETRGRHFLSCNVATSDIGIIS